MTQIKIACQTKDYLPLDSLVEFQGELKSLSEENYQKLKSEILQTGFAFPIYVWQSKDGINYILGGHQRTRTLRKLQKEGHEIPLIPCVLIEADNVKQAKRRIVQDVSQYGHVEKDGLYEFMNGESELSLEDLKNSFDLPGIDLDSFAIEYLEDNTVPQGEDDENIEPPVEPKSKLGDLWKLGNHRLLCGDSTMIDQVERLMNGKKADMVFTDPPYNTGMESKKQGGSTRLNHMFNDSFTEEQWQNLLSGMCANYFLATKDDAALYICLDWRRSHELVPHLKNHFKFSNLIIWDKMVHGLGSDYKYTHEFIHVCKKGKPELDTHQGDKEYSDVWHIQRKMGKDDEHATKKPVELVERSLRHASKNGHIVLDLFGGSGSTMMAAEKLKRHCYMMELDPKYIDVILNRWSKLTGKDPVRDDGVKWSELNG